MGTELVFLKGKVVPDSRVGYQHPELAQLHSWGRVKSDKLTSYQMETPQTGL